MIKEIERNGWAIQCPKCGRKTKYTTLNSWGEPWIIFYSNDGKSILLCEYGKSDEPTILKPDVILGKFSSYLNENGFDKNLYNIENNPICNYCNSELFKSENILPSSAIWIDKQVLIDTISNTISQVTIQL